MPKYYRLLDTQNGCYMATGYNAKGKADLFEQYASYKDNDWCENDEEESTKTIWATLTDDEKMDFIKDDCFDIEESETPFEELTY